MSSKNCPWTAMCLPVGTAMHSLGLALMVGGMLALGAFTAPVVFDNLPRDLAAPVMARIFTRYDVVLSVALSLVIFGEWLRWVSHALWVKTWLNGLRYVLLVCLTLGLVYSTEVINPQIQKLKHAGVHRNLLTPAGQQFEALHKRSESLYKLDLLAALLLILLTPFVRARPGHGDAVQASCSTVEHAAGQDS
jgi:hypothetical protein